MAETPTTEGPPTGTYATVGTFRIGPKRLSGTTEKSEGEYDRVTGGITSAGRQKQVLRVFGPSSAGRGAKRTLGQVKIGIHTAAWANGLEEIGAEIVKGVKTIGGSTALEILYYPQDRDEIVQYLYATQQGVLGRRTSLNSGFTFLPIAYECENGVGDPYKGKRSDRVPKI